ncbi:MAG: hypothetical protein KDD66_07745 [Bdellovibrionales bacterium]|nr:hypothetical protein [Bdellovibrionales bacterium]
MKRLLSLLLGSTTAAVLLLPYSAAAQVVISTTAEQVYDSNIYLESGDRIELPPGAVIPGGGTVLPEDLDGEENDDLITRVGVDLSGGHVVGNGNLDFVYDAGVGAIFFWENTDEDRITLDTFFELRSREKFLAKPLVASLSSGFASGGADIAVAEGTAASQIQTHTAEFSFGAEEWQWTRSSYANVMYRLTRHDFLGEFLLSDREDDRREPTGSDYFANSVDTSYVYSLAPDTDVNIDAFGTLINFTGTDSNGELLVEEKDRIDYGARVGFTKLFSQKLELRGAVGADLSYLVDEPDPVFVEVINPDGTTTTVMDNPSRNSSSLAFDLRLTYQALERTVVSAFVDQSSGVDTDGSRILVRSVGANLSHRLTQDFWLSAAGRFQQFEEGDELSDSTDRFDASVSARYALRPNMSLVAGYNFTDQSAGTASDPLVSTDNDDYTVHRLFLSFNVGFVGLPS